MTPDEIIDGLLGREGGFTNRKADPGGPTNWGLTQADWSFVLGRPATVADVKAGTREAARLFYFRKHVAPYMFIAHEPLRTLVIDTGVLMGVEYIDRLLQELVGVDIDGDVGPITRDAIGKANARALMRDIVFRRHRRELKTALADVAKINPEIITDTRLEDLVGWWQRTWTVGVLPL